MPSWRPEGLRWRLTLWVAAILVAAFAVTSVAVYRGTGSEVRHQIEHELKTDSDALARRAQQNGGPSAVAAAAAGFIRSQPFRASTRLLFETVSGRGTVSNEPELLGLRPDAEGTGIAREAPSAQSLENRQALELLGAYPGLRTLRLADVGGLRLLVRRVADRGRTIATIGVGESLAAVDRAQDGVARTLVLAGGLTLAAALLAANLLAANISRPLRGMARTATRVDAGELSPRIDLTGARDEARVLAVSFNHMLDRLADAFARQQAFVSDASHELRTPLTVIRGQLEVLARDRDPTPADVARVERFVRTEVERMTRLVDDLLVLACSDEPAFLQREQIDVGPFLSELLAGATHVHEARFRFEQLASGTLLADPDRLAQALRNVLRNGAQHSRRTGEVLLSVLCDEQRPGWLVVRVDDDGPGIPTEQRDRVFDRFHRTDRARDRGHGGSGIGLAIVRAVVDAHGGRVSAQDAPEGGARIEFSLPGFTAA